MKKVVAQTALDCLKTECAGLKKTGSLRYDSLKVQDYLSFLYPSHSKTIFKWRSQTLDIKSHSTYKYDNLTCSGCGIEDELPCHVINCGFEEEIEPDVDVLAVDKLDQATKCDLVRMVMRINSFIDRVTNPDGCEEPSED